jgi:hypothetical protein
MGAAARLRRAVVALLAPTVIGAAALAAAPGAHAADTTTPTLTAFSLERSAVSAPGRVTVHYEASDTAGSLKHVVFRYRNPAGLTREARLDTGPSLSGSVSFDLRDGDRNGLWVLESIALADPAGNAIRYLPGGPTSLWPTTTSGPTSHTFDLASGDVTVSGSNPDVTPPVIAAVALTPTDLEPTTVLTVDAQVSDRSAVRGLKIRLRHRDLGSFVDRVDTTLPGEAGSLTFSLGDIANGTYDIFSLSAWDEFGNDALYLATGEVQVSPDDATGPSSHALALTTTSVSLSGSPLDREPPVLTAITPPTGLVDPQSPLAASYSVEDASTLRHVDLTYAGPDGALWRLEVNATLPLTGSVTRTAPTTAGTYTLRSVTVYDSAGNVNFYSVDGTVTRGPGGRVTSHSLDLASSFTVRPLPPSTPPQPAAFPVSGAINLSWGPEPTLAPITGYTVTVSPGGRVITLPATANGVLVTGLANGTTYTLDVTASGPHATSAAARATATPRMSPRIIGTGDLSGDGRNDIVAASSAGPLFLYRGNGASGFGWGRVDLGNWTSPPTPMTWVGDFDGDLVSEVMSVEGDTLEAVSIHRGDGRSARTYGSRGWRTMRLLVGPGDFTGDRRADLLVVTATGDLRLYPGNGRGGFQPTRTIGRGWNTYLTVFSPGDFTGDGRSDVLAVDRAGDLYLYRGNGKGGFAAARQRIGKGWAGFMAVHSPRDFSGDRRSDVIAATMTGDLYLYRGNGTGGFSGARTKIGTGWQVFR